MSDLNIKLCETENEASLDSCSNDASFSGQSDSAELDEWELECFHTTKRSYLNRVYQFDDDYMNSHNGDSPSYYFCRVSLPESKKIQTERNKLWGLMKQAQQYKYYRHKLLSHTLTSCIQFMFCYFEQFKNGNIHFHLIVNIGKEHIINLKAELAELFGVSKKDEMKHFFHSQKIDDIEATHNYLFHKEQHAYENIDQEVFRPIILQRLQQHTNIKTNIIPLVQEECENKAIL